MHIYSIVIFLHTPATMDEIPKVRLSAAIFRRGGEKKELFGQTHEEDVSDEQVMAEKMSALESVWSAPRIGCVALARHVTLVAACPSRPTLSPVRHSQCGHGPRIQFSMLR